MSGGAKLLIGEGWTCPGCNASSPVFNTCPACGTALRSEADNRYVYFVCPACGLKEIVGSVAEPE